MVQIRVKFQRFSFCHVLVLEYVLWQSRAAIFEGEEGSRELQAGYATDYVAILIAAIISIALVALLLFLSWIFAPRHPDQAKASIYECGMIPIGEFWSQIHVRYYLFAILFVIFDVEAIFLFPWAVVLSGLGAFAFWEMLIFIAILFFGLAYAWRKGVLQWK